MLRKLRDLLLPGMPDEGFRQELSEDVRFATLAVGGFEMLLSLILPWLTLAAGLTLGLLTIAVAHVPQCYGILRWCAIGSSYLWLLLLQWVAGPSDTTFVAATAVVICVAALLPLTPHEGLIHAAAIAILGVQLWPVPVLSLVGAALAPFQHRYRRARYEAQLRLIQSTQELRVQQERALSAQHAASLERLAAAISHELNTPVGAIKSSVQTLQSIVEKLGDAGEPLRQKLTAMHAEICACLATSTARVQSIVERLQRLTSLDRAAVRPTDINQVLQDVAATAQSVTPERVTIRLELEPLPIILCEAQAWTTILTRLVLNAAAHPGQRILELRSAVADQCISVQLTEPGREVRSADMAHAFDPRFDQDGGRIGTSNWDAFQLRTWVQQLGGELRLSGGAGGATTRLLIPANTSPRQPLAVIESVSKFDP